MDDFFWTHTFHHEWFACPLQEFLGSNSHGDEWTYGPVISEPDLRMARETLADHSQYKRVYYEKEGAHDEDEWMFIVQHANGAYIYFNGSCDFTGFQCRGDIEVVYGMDPANFYALGIPDADKKVLRKNFMSVCPELEQLLRGPMLSLKDTLAKRSHPMDESMFPQRLWCILMWDFAQMGFKRLAALSGEALPRDDLEQLFTWLSLRCDKSACLPAAIAHEETEKLLRHRYLALLQTFYETKKECMEEKKSEIEAMSKQLEQQKRGVDEIVKGMELEISALQQKVEDVEGLMPKDEFDWIQDLRKLRKRILPGQMHANGYH